MEPCPAYGVHYSEIGDATAVPPLLTLLREKDKELFFVRLFIAERMGKQCIIEIWAGGMEHENK